MRSSRFFGYKPADHQRLKPRDSKLGAIGGGKFRNVIAGEAHMDLLRRVSTFIELKAAGIEIDIVAVDRCSARAVGHAFAAIAQRIEFRRKSSRDKLLADEQLQWPCIDLGRNGPALAGEFFLDHGIQVNGEASQGSPARQD